VAFLLRDEAFDDGAHCEWYQISRNFFCEYDRTSREIIKLSMYGKDVQDDDIYRTAMQRFHFISMEEFMGISVEEI